MVDDPKRIQQKEDKKTEKLVKNECDKPSQLASSAWFCFC